MSLIFETAIEEWRRVRHDYSLHLAAMVDRAETACAGVLLNEHGRAKHVDPETLFLGPWARAVKYASAELLDYWRDVEPRMTFELFERQAYEWSEDL